MDVHGEALPLVGETRPPEGVASCWARRPRPRGQPVRPRVNDEVARPGLCRGRSRRERAGSPWRRPRCPSQRRDAALVRQRDQPVALEQQRLPRLDGQHPGADRAEHLERGRAHRRQVEPLVLPGLAPLHHHHARAARARRRGGCRRRCPPPPRARGRARPSPPPSVPRRPGPGAPPPPRPAPRRAPAPASSGGPGEVAPRARGPPGAARWARRCGCPPTRTRRRCRASSASSRKLRSRAAIRRKPRSGRACGTARIREKPPASTASDTPCLPQQPLDARHLAHLHPVEPLDLRGQRRVGLAHVADRDDREPLTARGPGEHPGQRAVAGDEPDASGHGRRSAGEPALAGGDEGRAAPGPRPGRPSSVRSSLHGLLERQLAAEEDLVGLLHPGDLLLGEAVRGRARWC